MKFVGVYAGTGNTNRYLPHWTSPLWLAQSDQIHISCFPFKGVIRCYIYLTALHLGTLRIAATTSCWLHVIYVLVLQGAVTRSVSSFKVAIFCVLCLAVSASVHTIKWNLIIIICLCVCERERERFWGDDLWTSGLTPGFCASVLGSWSQRCHYDISGRSAT